MPVFTQKYAAFLFDMDGTLIDSTGSTTRVWGAWAVRNGLDPEIFLPTIHGVRGIDTISRLALPGLDPEEEAAGILAAEMDDVHDVVSIPGAVEFLNSLPSDSWAIVTSAPADLAKRRLAAAGVAMPDVMVTGVTGTRLHTVKACHSNHWDVLADGPAETRVRPFDNSRTGEALSEAACTLILEAREHAEARGAKILGTILGCGSSSVSNRSGHPDEATAVCQSAAAAIARAGLSVEDIGHVNACASGHPRRDQYEAEGLRRLFGNHADSVPVTAVKSYLGSTGSAAGLCEIAASLLALQHGVIPKTLNFSTPDSEAPLNVVHGEHQPCSNGIFLKTSVTRVGQASAVVVRV